MNQKELNKTFVTIPNWNKNTFDLQGFHKKNQRFKGKVWSYGGSRGLSVILWRIQRVKCDPMADPEG